MVTPRRLERYWADLQHDPTVVPPAGLDPAIADVVARLDRAARPPEPRGAFLEQLRQRLVEAGSSASRSASEETDELATLTGTSADPVSPQPRRRRWPASTGSRCGPSSDGCADTASMVGRAGPEGPPR